MKRKRRSCRARISRSSSFSTCGRAAAVRGALRRPPGGAEPTHRRLPVADVGELLQKRNQGRRRFCSWFRLREDGRHKRTFTHAFRSSGLGTDGFPLTGASSTNTSTRKLTVSCRQKTR